MLTECGEDLTFLTFSFSVHPSVGGCGEVRRGEARWGVFPEVKPCGFSAPLWLCWPSALDHVTSWRPSKVSFPIDVLLRRAQPRFQVCQKSSFPALHHRKISNRFVSKHVCWLNSVYSPICPQLPYLARNAISPVHVALTASSASSPKTEAPQWLVFGITEWDSALSLRKVQFKREHVFTNTPQAACHADVSSYQRTLESHQSSHLTLSKNKQNCNDVKVLSTNI